MYKIVKDLKSASITHRLIKGYKGACSNFHGHTYKFQVAVIVNSLDQYDMGVDFKDLKTICDKFIQDNWDHAALVSLEDESFIEFLQEEKAKYYAIPGNTTAENMCEFLAKHFFIELRKKYNNINKLIMKVWETDTSYVEVVVGNKCEQSCQKC